MKITFKVELDLNHIRGPYVSKEALVEAIKEDLESNIPADVCPGDSQYEVVESNVEETP